MLLALAVVLVIVGTKFGGTASDRQALPTATPSLVPTESPQPPAYDKSRALAVVLGGDSQWSVVGERLIRSSPGHRARSVPLGSLHLKADDEPTLALDLPHDMVWLVVANSVPTRVVVYNSRTLHRIAGARWAQSVYGAAAVNGYLYLANDLGIAEMSPQTMRPRVVSGLRGALGPVAADAVHHQLIALDVFNPMAVYSYRHGELPRESEMRLPISHGSVAVADGRIWVGGFGAVGAELYRIDPHTLEPIAGGRAPLFDPGAVVAAGGRDVVWVRNGAVVPDLLLCLNANSGRPEQRYHVIGASPIASTGGYAVLGTLQGVVPMDLTRCAG